MAVFTDQIHIFRDRQLQEPPTTSHYIMAVPSRFLDNPIRESKATSHWLIWLLLIAKNFKKSQWDILEKKNDIRESYDLLFCHNKMK